MALTVTVEGQRLEVSWPGGAEGLANMKMKLPTVVLGAVVPVTTTPWAVLAVATRVARLLPAMGQVMGRGLRLVSTVATNSRTPMG